MSWTTKDTCSWRQKDLKALQVHLKSSGCDGVWAAPLWITPLTWIEPQHASGEVDVFERGCATNDGYLVSFGDSEPFIMHNAWGEQGKAADPSDFVAHMAFDFANDKVTMRRCPPDSNPMATGDFSQCTAPVEFFNYFYNTSKNTNQNTAYMHFVSDVWNKCGSLACAHSAKPDAACSFSVSGIQMQFTDEATAGGKSPFKDSKPLCNPLLFSGSRTGFAQAGDLCGQDSPQHLQCDPSYPALTCSTSPSDTKNRCRCTEEYSACGPNKVCAPSTA